MTHAFGSTPSGLRFLGAVVALNAVCGFASAFVVHPIPNHCVSSKTGSLAVRTIGRSQPYGSIGLHRHSSTARWGFCQVDADRIKNKVVIVGAGVAGLACAATLKEKGIPFQILEASDGVGGRIRTDKVDGFLLDRGFQIFLTSYPEAQRLLDYRQLDLQPFYPGAQVRHAGGFHTVADPFRRPLDALASLLPTHPIGSVFDKIMVGVLRLQSLVGDVDDLYLRPDITIEERLSSDVFFGYAFSREMIDRFFRPFFGGIFFDSKLRTTARELDFVFRMLALGENCLPKKGMQAVPDFLGGLLPKDTIRLGAAVREVSSDGSYVTLADGERIPAAAVVVATEGDAARRLLPGPALDAAGPDGPDGPAGPAKQTTCLYFAIDGRPPVEEGVLFLNGDGVGDAEGTCTINNMCFPSNVAPSYAPEGKSLASVSLIGIPKESDADAAAAVKNQLTNWFGPSVADWRFLKAYRITYAQPNQEPPTDREKEVQLKPFLFVAGDHRETASLNGALRSGVRAADAVAAALVPILLRDSQQALDEYLISKAIDPIKP